jgi:hypothetical protein
MFYMPACSCVASCSLQRIIICPHDSLDAKYSLGNLMKIDDGIVLFSRR